MLKAYIEHWRLYRRVDRTAGSAGWQAGESAAWVREDAATGPPEFYKFTDLEDEINRQCELNDCMYDIEAHGPSVRVFHMFRKSGKRTEECLRRQFVAFCTRRYLTAEEMQKLIDGDFDKACEDDGAMASLVIEDATALPPPGAPEPTPSGYVPCPKRPAEEFPPWEPGPRRMKTQN